jgi:hypothetical protein
MAVKFKIRRSDLNRLFTMADARKPPESQEWLVMVKVEAYIAQFQIGPEYVELPAGTIAAGSAEFPSSSLKKQSQVKRRKSYRSM